MQSGWRVGSLFKIPLFIDPSWLWIVALFTFQDGLMWQQMFPAWPVPLAYGTGLAMALLLFGSVLLHELGHSLVAQSKGIEVSSIRLFMFGGVAAIEREPKTPGQMLQIAVAGPAVSALLWLGLTLVANPVSHFNLPVALLLAKVASVNLTLLLFNLIPGLPLDGGQMLKSGIWKWTGNYITAVHWAAKTGRWLGLAISLIGLSDVLGVTQSLGLPQIGGFWAILIGWFMQRNASSADQMATLQEALQGLKAADAMTREYKVLDANMTLRQYADDHVLLVKNPTTYFASSDGRYRGWIAPDVLEKVDRSLWESQTLQDVVQPLSAIPTVAETTPMADVIQLMEAKSLPRMTVLTPAGAVAGMIDRGDITKVVSAKMGFELSDRALQQIKEAGVYPPGLPLVALAQTVKELEPAAPVAEPIAEPVAQPPA
jgi:Zn-dependent protease